MFTYQREAIDLCGVWGFYPDPFERGLRQKWYEKERDASSAFPCFDCYTNTVEVPHSWNAQNPEMKFYDGTCMYLKEFDLPDVDKIKKEKEAWICFDGVNYHSEVYLNGQLVGMHDGGYSPFQMNITPYLQQNNKLWVAVNNRNEKNRVPSVIYDWWNDGGIFRPVKIVFTPKKYIKNFAVKTNISAGEAFITVEVELVGGKADEHTSYQIQVKELNLIIEGTAMSGAKQKNELRIPLDKISLWSPENPKLYHIEICTESDRITDEVGFREIRVHNKKILLNGQPVFLRGLNFHDEYKENGRVPKKELVDEAFAAFKDLGVNFVRLAHYPHNEYLVRKADREGIMLWAEIPVYWYVYWELEGVYEIAERMMHEMIDRDMNRASVIIWSVGNEMPMDNKQMHSHYLIKLVESTRKTDATRLISYACSMFIKNEQGDGGYPGMPSGLYDTLDIIAVNRYSGFGGNGKPEELDFIINEYAKFGKPVMISEYGATSVLGYENGKGDVFSEETHVDVFSRQTKTILNNPNICGLTPWHFCDIRTPIFQTKLSNLYFRYGFVDENWNPKKAYFVLKEFYNNLIMMENI